MYRSDGGSQMKTQSPHIKGKRPHARRSCLACRKQKARCRLPNLQVPSSLQPLDASNECQRCSALGKECIVWDGDRKGARYTLGKMLSRKEVSSGQHRDANEEAAKDQELFSPYMPFHPAFVQQESQSRMKQRVASSFGCVDHTRNASGYMHSTQDSYTKMKLINLQRKPFALLTELLSKQNKFRCGVPPSIEVGESAPWAKLDQLLKDISSSVAHVDDTPLILHHAHLPRLRTLISHYRSQPSTSTAFLVCCCVYLCQAWGSGKEYDDVPAQFLLLMRQLGLRIIVGAPQSIAAAQGLELVAVHIPFLLDDGDEEEAGVLTRRISQNEAWVPPGARLIEVALGIARNFKCEQADRISFCSEEDRLRRCALWTSLCCWEVVFSFHNDTTASPRRMDVNMRIDWSNNPSSPFEEKSEYYLRRAASIVLAERCKVFHIITKHNLENEDNYRKAESPEELKTCQLQLVEQCQGKLESAEMARCLVFEQLYLMLRNDGQEHILPSVHQVEKWIDIEAYALHSNLLYRLLGHCHLFSSRESRQIPRPTSTQRDKDSRDSDPPSTLWNHPEWESHVGLLGTKRMSVQETFISQAAFLFQSVKKGPQSIPTPLLCAYVVDAAKGILDMQAVMLLGWHTLHANTTFYILSVQRVASMLLKMDICTINKEVGIGQCTEGILRVIADTLLSWQRKQKIAKATEVIGENRNEHCHHIANRDTVTLAATPLSTDLLEKGQSSIRSPQVLSTSSLEDVSPEAYTHFNYDIEQSLDTLLQGILDIPAHDEKHHLVDPYREYTE